MISSASGSLLRVISNVSDRLVVEGALPPRPRYPPLPDPCPLVEDFPLPDDLLLEGANPWVRGGDGGGKRVALGGGTSMSGSSLTSAWPSSALFLACVKVERDFLGKALGLFLAELKLTFSSSLMAFKAWLISLVFLAI